MPVAVIDSGIVSATGVAGARQLIPGVEPGGSRAGKDKPVLLIRDLTVELINVGRGAATADIDELSIELALSQEQSLDPAQWLHLASYKFSGPATADVWNMGLKEDFTQSHVGTIWAAAFVGLAFTELAGQLSSYQFRVFLNYDVLLVPHLDWFIMWDWLDNVVDGDLEY